MALHTSWQSQLGKRLLVRALLKKLSKEDVTSAADVGHGIYSGRRGAMVSVAGGTGWRRRVTLREHLGVDALLVASCLVGGNSVGFHVDGVGVAASARCSHIGWIDRRPSVRGGKNIVHTVAIDAGSHLAVALLQSLAVYAGQVLTQ